MNMLPKDLTGFDSDLRIIDSIWLRDEIKKLRPKGISDPGFSLARKDAQVKPATNTLTLNEAIRVIFVCLYKPNKKPLIKASINGPNLTQLDPLDLNEWVNKWIDKGYPYARDLVITVYQAKLNLTVEELKIEAKKLGVEISVKKVKQFLRIPRTRRLRSKTLLKPSETRMLMRNLHDLHNY